MTCPLQSEIGRRWTSVAIIRRLAMARYRPDAFPCCRPWQDIAPMRSQAAGHGKIAPRCVPEGASDEKTPVRGNISPACIQIQLILARYARHASKKPRKAPLGNAPREHLAAKGRFRRPKPSNHARRTNLAILRWPCPCAGAPARATASRDRPSTAWPLPRGGAYPPQRLANTCHSLYPPLALQTQPNTPSWARWLLPKKRNGARQRIKVWKRQLGFRYKQRLAFEGCVMPSTRRIG